VTDTIVIATIGCEQLHLTEARVISPVLIPGGEVAGSIGSSADFCDICGESATVLCMTAQDAVLETDAERQMYSLRSGA
jgi:hypothetical protein